MEYLVECEDATKDYHTWNLEDAKNYAKNLIKSYPNLEITITSSDHRNFRFQQKNCLTMVVGMICYWYEMSSTQWSKK